MPFKKITLKEWKALRLPTEIFTIQFSNSEMVKKLRERQNKKKIQKGNYEK